MERTPGESPADRAKYWVKIIEEARQYAAGVTAFCDDRGINKNNYYGWFNKLRAEHPEWSDLKKSAGHRAKRTKTNRQKKVSEKIEVEPRATRRKFSAKYKQKILKELDSASSGEAAALLRREGLYASVIHKWRRQSAENSLAPQKRGPKKEGSDSARVKSLEAKVAQLEKKLKHKDMLLDLQKKIAEILETTSE